MNAFLAALLAVYSILVAFVLCVLASTVLAWHAAVTGPAAGACAVGLVACGVWLNRAAGSDA